MVMLRTRTSGCSLTTNYIRHSRLNRGGSGFASVEDPFFSALKNKKKGKTKNAKKCLGKELDD
jgi:hypothetical protein